MYFKKSVSLGNAIPKRYCHSLTFFVCKTTTLIDRNMSHSTFSKFFPVIALLLVSCVPVEKETELNVSPTNLTLYHDQTYQITTNKPGQCTYKVFDPWYASVDATGLVTAHRIGTTRITVTDGSSTKYVSLTVKSKYDLYPLLEQYLGKSISQLTSSFGNYDETYQSGNIREYRYKNRGKYGISFTFMIDPTDATQTITFIAVYISSSYLDQINGYIFSRYYCHDVLNDVYYLRDYDKTASLRISYLTGQYQYLICYYPYTTELL